MLLALLLARAGIGCVVIERRPAPYPLPRAIAFDHEVGRILQAAGLADQIGALTTDMKTYAWLNAAGETLMSFDWVGVGSSGWPVSRNFCQPELEALLAAHLQRQPGVRVLRGSTVDGLTQTPDDVELTIAGTEPLRVSARFVIGADGANSFVRGRMAADYEDLGFHYDWLVVDVLPADMSTWDTRVWQICDPARPTTVVPGGPGRRRWEFMLLPHEQAADMATPEAAWRLLAPWGLTPGNAVLERHAVYRFGAAWANRWRDRRVLLAGDAAHLSPPFAGQGLCSGLRDAMALAWRLRMLLADTAHPDRAEVLLESYSSERCAHARYLIDVAVEMGKVICITDPQAAAARDAQMLAGQRDRLLTAAAPALPQPRLGPGLRRDDAAAGFLALQAEVESHGRRGLFDDVVGRGFVLLVRDRGDLATLGDRQRRFLTHLGAHVVSLGDAGPVRDVSGAYARWLGDLRCCAVLMRPDFYVFGTAAVPAEIPDLVNDLARALRCGLET